MDTTINEVLQFAEENDIKFVRLAFCDIFGTEKNMAISISLTHRKNIKLRATLRTLMKPSDQHTQR